MDASLNAWCMHTCMYLHAPFCSSVMCEATVSCVVVMPVLRLVFDCDQKLCDRLMCVCIYIQGSPSTKWYIHGGYHIFLYTYADIHTCIHIYLYLYIYIHVHTHTYTRTIYIYAYILHTHYVHIYIRIGTQTYGIEAGTPSFGPSSALTFCRCWSSSRRQISLWRRLGAAVGLQGQFRVQDFRAGALALRILGFRAQDQGLGLRALGQGSIIIP